MIRFLYEAKLLGNLRWVNGVSGGAIMAAHLLSQWTGYSGGEREFGWAAQKLIAVTQCGLRGCVVRRWILAWLFPVVRLLAPGRFTLGRILQREYERRLYRGKTLSHLMSPTGPQVFLSAVSMSTGTDCQFGRSGFMWHDEKDGRERNVTAPALPVALAVAASSAFPPLFPPVRISHRELQCDLAEFPVPHWLSDGGVYDNLGLERFLWHQTHGLPEIDVFLVSDAEAVFQWQDDPFHLPLGRNVRASELMMKRMSALTYGLAAGSSNRVVPIGIGAVIERPPDANVQKVEVQRALRTVRTDLDAFSSLEIRCLIRHGYAVAREALIGAGLVPAADAPNYSWEPLPGFRRNPSADLSASRFTRFWSAADWVLLPGLGAWVYLLYRLAVMAYETMWPEAMR